MTALRDGAWDVPTELLARAVDLVGVLAGPKRFAEPLDLIPRPGRTKPEPKMSLREALQRVQATKAG